MLVAVLTNLGDALSFAFGMFWEILWALILGFALSAAVQAVVAKGEMRRLLPDDSAHSLVIATGLGAASSSCSYASVALARSIFRKGADFTAAMAFQFASTNLVVELGIIMALLLGWQFTLAEFIGGPLMIGLLALLFRRFLTQRLVDEAREQADKGLVGSMEGHAEMDMSVHRSGSVWQRLRSPEGFTATANYFVMDWAAIWRDILGGLLIAGALAAWVPESFWQRLVLRAPPHTGEVLGADHRAAGCHAELRLLDRKRPAGGRAVERRHQLRRRARVHLRRPDHPAHPRHLPPLLRPQDGRIPARHLLRRDGALRTRSRTPLPGGRPHTTERHAKIVEASITWNYTTILNIAFLALAAVLVWRFVATGGLPMLKMMNAPPSRSEPAHDHGSH